MEKKQKEMKNESGNRRCKRVVSEGRERVEKKEDNRREESVMKEKLK